MDKVKVTIDNKVLEVPRDYTVLKAAKEANIKIPTLCFLKDINEVGACRICMVEIEGINGLQASCIYPVFDNMVVHTKSKKVREARKVTLGLILSDHDRKCLTCVRNQNCELQALSEEFGMRDILYDGERNELPIDDKSVSIVRDPNKCILCKRCVSVCSKVQSVSVLTEINRGFKTEIGCTSGKSLSEVSCVNCGQCIVNCPVGALREKDDTDRVWDAIDDKDKVVIVQTAPAIRAALGEEFGMEIGTRVTGKMVTALKQLGFDKVFDTDNGADFTILEEGTEVIERIKKGENLPVITSCSPAWIKFCEHNFPEFVNNLSSAKSPHIMLGALIKSYYAEKEGLDPKNIVNVSIMPCTAKKFECKREENEVNGNRDVDIVITTRELARMIKESGIDFNSLEDSEFDNPLGESTGAAAIFGTTGGVMEAALRTVADILTGKSLENVDYTEVRGVKGVKEAGIEIGDLKLKIAVAHGLSNARELLNRVKSGEAEYHFIEVMACPGGCVNGGGQPIRSARLKNWMDIRVERAKALYEEDQVLTFRKSHENQAVKKVYDEYLGEPGGHKSHELLHTHFYARKLDNEE